MFFAAPLWLIGLLPWFAVTVWLFRGRRKSEKVPFLPLWRGPAANQRVRSAFSLPPFAIIAMLLSVLLGLIAAAKPNIHSAQPRAVSIVVDRGLTMSAKGAARARFMEATELIEKRLQSVANQIEIIDPLSGERRKTTLTQMREVIAAMPRTAMDTSSLLRSAIRNELARNENFIVLLSDHAVQIADLRFKQIVPETMLQNVGIAAITAREMPSPQVMVSVRNDSAMTEALLQVESTGYKVERRLKLPIRGGNAAYFIDLPKLGDVIEARLQIHDDVDADDVAYLVREKRAARIEPRTSIPESLRRMIDVYERVKPPEALSAVVAVVNQKSDLRVDDVGVVIESPLAQGDLRGELRVVSDPLTAIVNWGAVTMDAKVSASAPEGWTPLVQVGGKTLVAMQENPARKIWVGFDSPAWPRSVDYVVFWTNVFDWLGNGGQTFVSHSPVMDASWKREGNQPVDIQADTWPGIYVRSDGQEKAVNAPFAQAELRGGDEVKLDLQPSGVPGIRRELTAEFCLAAMGCTMLAALFWRRSIKSVA